MKNIQSSLKGVSYMVLTAAAIGIPGLAFAATYQYVNTSGNLQTVTADNGTQAIALATDRAAHSGVMLVTGYVPAAPAPVYYTNNVPNISNVTVNQRANSADVSWTTSRSSKGLVYYSANPLVLYERAGSADVSGNTALNDSAFHTSQDVTISNLNSNTTYYYMIYTTDTDGNVNVTLPSTFTTSN